MKNTMNGSSPHTIASISRRENATARSRQRCSASSPTDVEARMARATTATDPLGLPARLAQLRSRLPGRDDVEVHAGPELEAGEVGQARDDVDAPAEVLGTARRGAHPQVQRRHDATQHAAQPV